jgi:hypothetical protein
MAIHRIGATYQISAWHIFAMGDILQHILKCAIIGSATLVQVKFNELESSRLQEQSFEIDPKNSLPQSSGIKVINEVSQLILCTCRSELWTVGRMVTKKKSELKVEIISSRAKYLFFWSRWNMLNQYFLDTYEFRGSGVDLPFLWGNSMTFWLGLLPPDL